MYIFLYLLPHLFLILIGYYNTYVCMGILFLSHFIYELDTYAYENKNNNNMFLKVLKYRSVIYDNLEKKYIDWDKKLKKNKYYLFTKIFIIRFLQHFDEIIAIFTKRTINRVKEKATQAMMNSMFMPGESFMMIQDNGKGQRSTFTNMSSTDMSYEDKTKLIGNLD